MIRRSTKSVGMLRRFADYDENVILTPNPKLPRVGAFRAGCSCPCSGAASGSSPNSIACICFIILERSESALKRNSALAGLALDGLPYLPEDGTRLGIAEAGVTGADVVRPSRPKNTPEELPPISGVRWG